MGGVKNEDGAAAFRRSGMFARQFDGLLHCSPKSRHLLGHRWDTMAWLGVGLYVGSDPRAGWCSPYLEHAAWSLCFMRHLVPVLL